MNGRERFQEIRLYRPKKQQLGTNRSGERGVQWMKRSPTSPDPRNRQRERFLKQRRARGEESVYRSGAAAQEEEGRVFGSGVERERVCLREQPSATKGTS